MNNTFMCSLSSHVVSMTVSDL